MPFGYCNFNMIFSFKEKGLFFFYLVFPILFFFKSLLVE